MILFWEEGVLNDLRTSKLVVRIKKDRPRDFIDDFGKHCVSSQEQIWIDPKTNEEMARVHQYLTNEGKIGASGFPDPKAIFVAEMQYRLTTDGNTEDCEVCQGHRPIHANPIHKRARYWRHRTRVKARDICTWGRKLLRFR